MKIRTVACTLATLLALVSAPVLAGHHNAATLANIVIGLKHFPGDEAKGQLRAITESADSSAAEKQIATAILNIEHSAKPEDREKLAAIAADESAHEDLRTLARAVQNINHFPKPEDVAALEQIASR